MKKKINYKKIKPIIEPLQPPIPLWSLSDKTQGLGEAEPSVPLVSTVTNNPFLATF